MEDSAHIEIVRAALAEPESRRGVLLRRLCFDSPRGEPSPRSQFTGEHAFLEALNAFNMLEEDMASPGLRSPKWIHTFEGESPGQRTWIVTDRPPRSEPNPDDPPPVFPYPDEAIVLIRRLRTVLPTLPRGARVLDLCTGAGSIGIWAAKQRPDLQIIGSDSNADAIAQARDNVALNGVGSSVSLVHGDLFEAVGSDPFDLIIGDPDFRPRFRAGPAGARDADPGDTGDHLVIRILEDAHTKLKPVPHARLLLLCYSLGEGGPWSRRTRHRLQRFVPSTLVASGGRVGNPFEPADTRMWRIKYRKAFKNPMPVDYLLLRLGDPTRVECVMSDHIDQTAREQIIDECTGWIETIKRRERATHLHYLLADFRFAPQGRKRPNPPRRPSARSSPQRTRKAAR